MRTVKKCTHKKVVKKGKHKKNIMRKFKRTYIIKHNNTS